jgi:hypothetical protein
MTLVPESLRNLHGPVFFFFLYKLGSENRSFFHCFLPPITSPTYQYMYRTCAPVYTSTCTRLVLQCIPVHVQDLQHCHIWSVLNHYLSTNSFCSSVYQYMYRTCNTAIFDLSSTIATWFLSLSWKKSWIDWHSNLSGKLWPLPIQEICYPASMFMRQSLQFPSVTFLSFDCTICRNRPVYKSLETGFPIKYSIWREFHSPSWLFLAEERFPLHIWPDHNPRSRGQAGR